MDPVYTDTLRLALALLFVATSLHKLRGLEDFRSALAAYRVLPDRLVVPIANGLIAAEGILVLLLVIPFTARIGAIFSALILIVYSTAIAINLARGRRDIACGCGGIAGSRQLAPSLLWRNALFVLVCLLATLPEASRALIWLDRLTICLAVTTIALAGYAVSLLADLSQNFNRPMGRRLSR